LLQILSEAAKVPWRPALESTLWGGEDALAPRPGCVEWCSHLAWLYLDWRCCWCWGIYWKHLGWQLWVGCDDWLHRPACV